MISVVIPAYNEEKTLGFCLEALARQKTDKVFEVIVVDNNSTDRTVEVALQYKRKLFIRVISEKQKGRSPARRAGFAAAKGDIIFSTDADTIVPTDWIAGMLPYFSDPTIVAVTGTCTIDDCSRRINTSFNMMQPLSMKLYRLAFRHYWLSGFNFAIRKKIYEKSGGFDPYMVSQEDTELSFRVYKLGKIKFVPKPSVICSGRRFKKGMIPGLSDYVSTYISNVIMKNEKVVLSDAR